MNLAASSGKRFGRLSLCALLLTTLSLSGCTAVSGTGPTTLVRVIDAAYNSQALDAYVASTPIAVNFTGPSISNYAFLPPSTATIKIVPTGKSTVLAQVSGTLLASQQHTAYITGQGSNFQVNLLSDQNTPAPAGAFSVRFLQEAVSTGAVDIYFVPDGTRIADAKPVFSGLASGAITAYTNIPPGNYDLIVVPAGTTTNAYTSSATTFSSGQVRTMLIVDQQLLNTPPVNVLVANDVN
jgi:Domain of unknown function (DUF4397)